MRRNNLLTWPRLLCFILFFVVLLRIFFLLSETRRAATYAANELEFWEYTVRTAECIFPVLTCSGIPCGTAAHLYDEVQAIPVFFALNLWKSCL